MSHQLQSTIIAMNELIQEAGKLYKLINDGDYDDKQRVILENNNILVIYKSNDGMEYELQDFHYRRILTYGDPLTVIPNYYSTMPDNTTICFNPIANEYKFNSLSNGIFECEIVDEFADSILIPDEYIDEYIFLRNCKSEHMFYMTIIDRFDIPNTITILKQCILEMDK